MSAPNDGGAAFPYVVQAADGTPAYEAPGMSLRDYFAAAALTGLAPRLRGGEYYPIDAAAEAYRVADAMLAERGRPTAAPVLLKAALQCLDANGHLRGCEGSGGDDDACTPHCEGLRRAIADAERTP